MTAAIIFLSLQATMIHILSLLFDLNVELHRPDFVLSTFISKNISSDLCRVKSKKPPQRQHTLNALENPQRKFLFFVKRRFAHIQKHISCRTKSYQISTCNSTPFECIQINHRLWCAVSKHTVHIIHAWKLYRWNVQREWYDNLNACTHFSSSFNCQFISML